MERFDMETNINPFYELKKEQIETELDTRKIGIDYRKMNKKELQELLSETLQGIQRPTALICPSFRSNSYKLVEKYEISNCEPLHDITNVVQNLLTELPCHLDQALVQTEYHKCFEITIGDKNQIKGSDARLYAVKFHTDQVDSFKRQESNISKQAHLLPQRGNTIIPGQIVTTRSTLIQAHYERISDFLVCGKHVLWQVADDNIEFLDGPDEEEYRPCGPTLHHFSKSNLKTKYERLNINWEKCVNKISQCNFQLPCLKVKIYKEGQFSKVVNTDLELERETESCRPIQIVTCQFHLQTCGNHHAISAFIEESSKDTITAIKKHTSELINAETPHLYNAAYSQMGNFIEMSGKQQIKRWLILWDNMEAIRHTCAPSTNSAEASHASILLTDGTGLNIVQSAMFDIYESFKEKNIEGYCFGFTKSGGGPSKYSRQKKKCREKEAKNSEQLIKELENYCFHVAFLHLHLPSPRCIINH
ncbi:unnamed protein product [Mytilus coruscus]|uniref:Uncharacterized protein n=1 Tax=Mytilus coruscus TaxID=42192 RepID=A0A6J8DCD2_MYTCO|nr:unnamed protein product [Mytilus coruscus]